MVFFGFCAFCALSQIPQAYEFMNILMLYAGLACLLCNRYVGLLGVIPGEPASLLPSIIINCQFTWLT